MIVGEEGEAELFGFCDEGGEFGVALGGLQGPDFGDEFEDLFFAIVDDLLELLKDVALKEDRSLIIVTHDARIFQFADRIAKMDDGRVVKIVENGELRGKPFKPAEGATVTIDFGNPTDGTVLVPGSAAPATGPAPGGR